MASYLDSMFKSKTYNTLTSFGPYNTTNASSRPLGKTPGDTCHEQFKNPTQVCSGRTVHYQNTRDWRQAANGIVGGICLLGTSLILRPRKELNLIVTQGYNQIQQSFFAKPRVIKNIKYSLQATGIILAATGIRHLAAANYSLETTKLLMKNSNLTDRDIDDCLYERY